MVQPYAIERVETSRGKVVYKAPKTRFTHQLSLSTSAQMTAMLKTVISNGTGRAASIGKPAAGKTGTTDDNKDAYFMGYTPNVVTGVWVGNDDNIAMNKSIQGGTVPALIWKDVMKVATEPYGNAEFNYPEVKLIPFAAGSNVKVIGEEEEEKKSEEHETPTDNMNSEDVAKQVNKILKQTETQQHPVQQAQPTQQAQPAPKPVQKPAAAPIPIPMAVPESLH